MHDLHPPCALMSFDCTARAMRSGFNRLKCGTRTISSSRIVTCCRLSTECGSQSTTKTTQNRRIIISTLLCAPLIAQSFSEAAIADDAISSTPLPKAYQEIARSLIENLRDAVDTDLSGATEREVRRKADPAKDLVRQFMSNWRDASPLVKQDVSYQEITSAIRELGEFYMKNGQRSRLSEEVGQSLLARLEAAQNALPPAPEKKSFLTF